MEKTFQLSLYLRINENGEFCTLENFVIDKRYLELALKFRSDVELAEALGITEDDLHFLITEFQIKLTESKRLTKLRIRIMEIIENHQEKHNSYPSLTHIRRTLRRMGDYSPEQLTAELNILANNGYIEFKQDKGITNLLRAV